VKKQKHENHEHHEHGDKHKQHSDPQASGEQQTEVDPALQNTASQVMLEEKEKEAAANYDKYLRAVAELDNYKKRAAKEKIDIIKYGKEDVIKDILPFVDSLDRALEHAEGSTDINAFKEGLKLIQDQLLGSLKKHGVEKIECAGQDFDPNFHEAMLKLDSEQHDENKIVNEYERGYLLNGRLLRPSKVSVCKKIIKENKICEKTVENVEEGG
jgi:molecular chaperone GrpE